MVMCWACAINTGCGVGAGRGYSLYTYIPGVHVAAYNYIEYRRAITSALYLGVRLKARSLDEIASAATGNRILQIFQL